MISFPTRFTTPFRFCYSLVLVLWLLPIYASATHSSDAAENAPNTEETTEQALSAETSARFYKQLNALYDSAVTALSQQISSGAPFLSEERRPRLEYLQKLPGNSAFELADKYRRLIETYRIELDYGKTIETYQAELNDATSKRLVNFLRIGRLALYYQTFDGQESGTWSREQKQWQRLPKRYDAVIGKGIRIARKMEPPQLLMLPLFGMQPISAVQLEEKTQSAEETAEPALSDADIELAMADLTSLSIAVRENAINLKTFFQQQIPSAKLAEQISLLDHLIDQQYTRPADIRRLLNELLTHLTFQGQVSTFQAPVYAPNGVAAEQQVLSAGGLTLISNGRYLIHTYKDGRLIELSRQPAPDILELAQTFPNTDAKSLALLAIDPSGGQILELLTQVPTLKERIAQGGAVGYLIILLGSLAFIISLFRFVQLTMISQGIQAQLKTQNLTENNPLGRLLNRLQQSPLNDEEALYLIVEESLTAEQNRLEQGLAFLKLVAAIAPMLGLLGTVTGMIETFQSIALHGSGDPKLMSGGISEALVTTVAGLVTAIPILLLHSLLAGKSRALTSTLEAHISAALAQRLEQRQYKPAQPQDD